MNIVYRDMVAERFVTFLKLNNANRQFMHELNIFSEQAIKTYVNGTCASKLHVLIDSAFDWGSTIKGIAYWNTLHLEWLNYFNEYSPKWKELAGINSEKSKCKSIW